MTLEILTAMMIAFGYNVSAASFEDTQLIYVESVETAPGPYFAAKAIISFNKELSLLEIIKDGTRKSARVSQIEGAKNLAALKRDSAMLEYILAEWKTTREKIAATIVANQAWSARPGGHAPDIGSLTGDDMNALRAAIDSPSHIGC